VIARIGGLLACALIVSTQIDAAGAAPAQQPSPLPPQRILLVGDSTAETMFPFLRDAAAARGVEVRSAARIGCSVIDGDPKLDDGRPYVDIYGDTSQCDAITSSEQDRLLATQRPDLVVWLSEWEAWPNRVLDGQLVHFGTIPGNKAILAHIDAAVARLTAGGARVVFMPTAPRASPSVRGLANPAGDSRIVQLAKLLRSYARQHTDKVSLVDLPTILQCPTGNTCPAEVGPGIRPRNLDGFHFDGDGAVWLAEQLMSMLVGATPPPAPPAPPACGTASLGDGRSASAGAECA
jgi:SGNH domain (fused to AT3 domains)